MWFWTLFETFWISEVPTSKAQYHSRYTILGYWSTRFAKKLPENGSRAQHAQGHLAFSPGCDSGFHVFMGTILLIMLHQWTHCAEGRSVSVVFYLLSCEQYQASWKTQRSAECLVCIRWLVNRSWMDGLKMFSGPTCEWGLGVSSWDT